jgi:hypothetical protein
MAETRDLPCYVDAQDSYYVRLRQQENSLVGVPRQVLGTERVIFRRTSRPESTRGE